MEHGAVRVLPKNGHRFINCNNKDLSTQLSPKPLSRCVLFYLAIYFLYRIEGKRHTALSVCKQSFFFFFNATPWHRATPLSRSAIAPVFPRGLGAKNEERESKMARVKELGGGTPWDRATQLSRNATVVIIFFPNATAWHSDVTLLALDQNVISSFHSYNHHLIGKEIDSWSSVEISRHHVVHCAKLPIVSLKPGSSFQKESHVTWWHKDTKLKILCSRSSTFQTYEITNLPPSKKNYNNKIVHDARLQKKKQTNKDLRE